MPICLFVRHGQTDWNRSGRVMGAQAIPLNPAGERQARELGVWLERTKIAHIYSSPVLRAMQTARILNEHLQTKIAMEPGLTEIGVGVWINRYWRELADDPAKRDWYAKPHEARPRDGETLGEVQRRAVSAVEAVLATQPSGHTLFVSHADVIRTILGHYLGIDLLLLRQMRIDNASATALDVTPHGSQLLFLNHRPAPDILL